MLDSSTNVIIVPTQRHLTAKVCSQLFNPPSFLARGAAGTVLSPEELRGICDFCSKSRVRLISDEIYHGITLTRPATTALKFKPDAVRFTNCRGPFHVPPSFSSSFSEKAVT
eukprot:2160441-Rhodomonas_salina.1